MQVITIMVVIASSRDDGVAPPLLPLPLSLPLSVENEADTWVTPVVYTIL